MPGGYTHPYLYLSSRMKMNQQSANSRSVNDSPRCQHRFANATRCRLLAPDADSLFCSRHLRLSKANGSQLPQSQFENADLSPDLLGEVREFKSASDIHAFLAKLLCLLAQNRVATKRAAVMAYITNQLLRALTAIQHETETKDATIVIDIDSAVARRALEARRAERENSTNDPS